MANETVEWCGATGPKDSEQFHPAITRSVSVSEWTASNSLASLYANNIPSRRTNVPLSRLTPSSSGTARASGVQCDGPTQQPGLEVRCSDRLSAGSPDILTQLFRLSTVPPGDYRVSI
jgi:hypothetical protein